MSQRHYAGQTVFSCQYCSHRTYVSDTAYIAKCGCGGRRGRTTDDDRVRCFMCGKVSALHTERLRTYDADMQAAVEHITEHEATEHRALQIFNAIHALEHAYTTRGWLHRDISDDQWATHPDCIEYRALMREWWALPNAQVQAVLYSPNNRTTPRLGAPYVGHNSANRIKKLVAQSIRNPETGWYELPGTLFKFYLARDEQEQSA